MEDYILIDKIIEWRKKKLSDKKSFSQYLSYIFYKNKDIRFSPIEASICIIEKCNLNCKHCYENHSNRFISYNDLENVLKQLKDLQVIELTITGGEPFLHPKIFDIITLAKKLKFVLNIQTNATLLDEKKIKKLKRLLNQTTDTIQVSLDGSTSKIHNCQRGNGFNETIANIKLLSQNNLKVIVNIAPSKYNEGDIYNTFKLAEKLGVYGFGATPLAYIGKGSKDIEPCMEQLIKQEWLIINDKTRKIKYYGGVSGELVHLVANKYFLSKIETNFNIPEEYDYKCNGGITKVHINALGEVYPCVFAQNKNLILGNILEESLYSIWFFHYKRSEFFKKKRTLKKEKCNNCILLSKCKGGCLGMAYEKYKDINKCDPRCLKV